MVFEGMARVKLEPVDGSNRDLSCADSESLNGLVMNTFVETVSTHAPTVL